MLNIILGACTNHVQAPNFCFIMCSLKSSNTLFKDLSLFGKNKLKVCNLYGDAGAFNL